MSARDLAGAEHTMTAYEEAAWCQMVETGELGRWLKTSAGPGYRPRLHSLARKLEVRARAEEEHAIARHGP